MPFAQHGSRIFAQHGNQVNAKNMSHAFCSMFFIQSNWFLLQSRELFCLMIERMKNMHTDDSNMGLNQITVFVGSWNMGNPICSISVSVHTE